jgi:hypothetical protein
MTIWVFENLPDDITQNIYLLLHKQYMRQIHDFIKQYVPDPVLKPLRFLEYYSCSQYIKNQAKQYKLSPVNSTGFYGKFTKMETLLVHNLIHNPVCWIT